MRELVSSRQTMSSERGTMSNPKRSDYPLVLMATAALLAVSLSAKLSGAAPQPGVCSGVLTKLEYEFAIVEDPEHICIFSGEDERKIYNLCAEGHRCEFEGILEDCKDVGECSELTNVSAVRDLTLAQKQEQPPLPEVPPSSAPTVTAVLPAEIQAFVADVARICGSSVNVWKNFSGFLRDDYRFIAIHFEKTQCKDPIALCRTEGCLHQIYVSKGNQPYQLVVSIYVSEIELKHLDGTVALEITTNEGMRLLRWNGAGFH